MASIGGWRLYSGVSCLEASEQSVWLWAHPAITKVILTVTKENEIQPSLLHNSDVFWAEVFFKEEVIYFLHLAGFYLITNIL